MHLILPFLSVWVGLALAYGFKSKIQMPTRYLLSFSGAFLLSVTIFEFLPQVYQFYSPTIGILIMSGVLLQVFLEFMSKGAEHGHLHPHKGTSFPLLLFISLSIHSFMEGFPIVKNTHLLYGVVIHKIPVALVIATFLLTSSMHAGKIFLFVLLFSLMTPLGSLCSRFIGEASTAELYINAVVIGIFLHVSTTILFESSQGHKFNLTKVIMIVLGVATAYFMG